VSEELWDQANRILTTQRDANRPPARRAVHLFAGFAYCACGSKMYVWSNSPKYRCQVCSNKIPIADLEGVYREQLHGFLLSPEEIHSHREAATEAIREKERLIESAEAELAKLAAEDDRLYALYLADELSKEDFGRRHRPLSARRDQLEHELPSLQAQVDVLRIGLLSQEEALQEAKDLWSRWGTLPSEEKRQIVEAITDRIVVGKEEIEIQLLHLQNGAEGGKATRPR
jgi:site-specific DNA recombinase